MKVSKKEHATLLNPEQLTVHSIAEELELLYATIEEDHLVLNLSAFDPLILDELIALLHISNKHRQASKSFVIINAHIPAEEVPDELVVVPSLQEAYDIIEMENIERDLGFDL